MIIQRQVRKQFQAQNDKGPAKVAGELENVSAIELTGYAESVDGKYRGEEGKPSLHCV